MILSANPSTIFKKKKDGSGTAQKEASLTYGDAPMAGQQLSLINSSKRCWSKTFGSHKVQSRIQFSVG
jgi:hypothetical protein